MNADRKLFLRRVYGQGQIAHSHSRGGIGFVHTLHQHDADVDIGDLFAADGDFQSLAITFQHPHAARQNAPSLQRHQRVDWAAEGAGDEDFGCVAGCVAFLVGHQFQPVVVVPRPGHKARCAAAHPNEDAAAGAVARAVLAGESDQILAACLWRPEEFTHAVGIGCGGAGVDRRLLHTRLPIIGTVGSLGIDAVPAVVVDHHIQHCLRKGLVVRGQADRIEAQFRPGHAHVVARADTDG